MPVHLDDQVAPALAPIMAAAHNAGPPPPVGDCTTRRAGFAALLRDLTARQTPPGGVTVEEFTAPAQDGTPIPLRLYRADTARPGGPLAVYLHGGGMIAGSLDTHDQLCRRYTADSGVPLLAVGYRLAPEHPHPTPAHDCHTAFHWAADHAHELDVDPARIAVMGDSAGGGLAAAVALIARDQGGPTPARQILIYPMLDDRTTTTSPEVAPHAVWTAEDNITGWAALLGAGAGGPNTHPHAAPARATDLTGLPPAYIEVGQLDIFRAENLDYAQRLADAGVEVELHLHPGVPHGWSVIAPESDVAVRAMTDRTRTLRRLWC